MSTTKKPKMYVVFNDCQAEFDDKPAMELTLRFIERWKPSGVVMNGDITDSHMLGQFVKDPKFDGKTLEREVKWADSLQDRIRTAIGPEGELTWIEGNHEYRVTREIYRNLPQFGVLPGSKFESIFHLQHYGTVHKEYGDGIYLGKLWVTHGQEVRKPSAYTAKAHFDRLGNSVMIGHTHRGGVYYKTDLRGPHASYENFCLCRLDPDWCPNPDWQQGFSAVHVFEGGWFNVTQIPIINRKMFMYGGELYTL